MATYELVVGDGGSVLTITVQDSLTRLPVDLTNKTVTARYAINGGATVQKPMTLLDQATHPGQAEYQFLTSDLSAAGELKGEIRLQAGQADQLTSLETFHIAIRSPLP